MGYASAIVSCPFAECKIDTLAPRAGPLFLVHSLVNIVNEPQNIFTASIDKIFQKLDYIEDGHMQLEFQINVRMSKAYLCTHLDRVNLLLDLNCK